MQVSIILPCKDEEANIAAAITDVLAWFSSAKIDGEVVVVNDGSRDASAHILSDWESRHPNLRVVAHSTNLGYGLAVRSGCDAAKGENIGFMDSDGQFRAEDLGLLLPHLKEYSFVCGRRRHRADSFIRNTFGKILGGLNVLFFGIWIRDVNCGMKLFRRELWPKIRPEHGTEKLFNTELFLRLRKFGIPWKQVDVGHYPRRAGTPTGGSVRVIWNMFRELKDLKRAMA